jgi:Spy/CpxP family protein refolding chaperone
MEKQEHRQSESNRVAEEPRVPRGIWGGVLAAAVLAALLVGGVLLSTSLANAGPGWLSGAGHWHWGHHRGHPDGEQVRRHAESMATWALRSVDASAEQQEQVKAIVIESADELFQLAGAHRDQREQLFDVLSQPTVDRQALEQIRQGQLDLVDAVSRQLTEALAEISAVLTAEQRNELLELAQAFHH